MTHTAGTRRCVPLEACGRASEEQSQGAPGQVDRAACVNIFLLCCDLLDDVIRLTQFMMTSLTLRRRTSEPNTRTASLMALITTSPTLQWVRLSYHMRAACSRRTRTRVTCFPMLDLSLIRFSSVKRSRHLVFF